MCFFHKWSLLHLSLRDVHTVATLHNSAGERCSRMHSNGKSGKSKRETFPSSSSSSSHSLSPSNDQSLNSCLPLPVHLVSLLCGNSLWVDATNTSLRSIIHHCFFFLLCSMWKSALTKQLWRLVTEIKHCIKAKPPLSSFPLVDLFFSLLIGNHWYEFQLCWSFCGSANLY